MTKQRLEYIDAMRGFTILMVIYVHLVNYGLFDLKGGWNECFYSPAVVGLKFRMPLFFFISGFFAYAVYDTQTFSKRVKNRLMRQLWPTIVVCLVFNGICFWHGWRSLIYNSHNDAYWFTQSLVQVFLFYAVVAYAMYFLKMNKLRQTITLAALIIIFVGLQLYIGTLGKLSPYHFLNYTYLIKTIPYSQFFFLGVLAKMWFDKTEKLFRKKWLYLLITAVFMAECILHPDGADFITRCSGIIAVYGCFYYSRSFWSNGNMAARAMNFLGRNTLPIYLFHYILLHPLFKCHLLVNLKGIYGTPYLEIPVLLIMSLAAACICTGIDTGMKRYIKPLHNFIFSPGSFNAGKLRLKLFRRNIVRHA